MSRLEEIKQHQWDGYTIWDMSEDDLIWLIKQAERAEELEEKSQLQHGFIERVKSIMLHPFSKTINKDRTLYRIESLLKVLEEVEEDE